jgi:2-beta-glucuronyltransferase
LSKRKAGFHWIAKSLADIGWDVLFVTTPLSPFSLITGDHRWEYIAPEERNVPKRINENISCFAYTPIYSPLSKTGIFIVDILSPLFIPLYRRIIPENLKKIVQDSDIIIFESTAAILLFGLICEINPRAKKVYRVSDSLEILKVHSSVLRYEESIIQKFDLISVPSHALLQRFKSSNVHLHYHGIDKSAFLIDTQPPDIYSSFEKNFVFIGNSFVDNNFITLASALFETYGFHVIGPISPFIDNKNVIFYGELPFSRTVPYIKYADVGLQIRRMDIGLETLSDSLKVLQYTWCKLPIIAPLGLNSTRNHVIYYHYDSGESIKKTVRDSILYDRSTIDVSDIIDWAELTEKIVCEVS